MNKKIVVALSAALMGSAAALAQTGGQIHSGNVLGNPTSSTAPATDATMSSMLDRAFGSVTGAILQRGASAWAAVTSFVIPTTGGLNFGTGLSFTSHTDITSYGSFPCYSLDLTTLAGIFGTNIGNVQHQCYIINQKTVTPGGGGYFTGDLSDFFANVANMTIVSNSALRTPINSTTPIYDSHPNFGLFSKAPVPANGSQGGLIAFEGNTVLATGTEANNPFATVSGSPTVTVTHSGIQALETSCGAGGGPLVGFWLGQGTFNGLTLLNTYPLTTTGANTATFTADGNASSTSSGGGAGSAYAYGCENTFARYAEIGLQMDSTSDDLPIGRLVFATSIAPAGGSPQSNPVFWMSKGLWSQNAAGGDRGLDTINLHGTAPLKIDAISQNLGPIGQLPGIQSATIASAGNVGELIVSNVTSGSPVSLVSATPKTITSISLTTGDWDVWATVQFTGGATTTVNAIQSSISQTTNVVDTTNDRFYETVFSGGTPFNFGTPISAPVGPNPIQLSGTTTIYLVAQCYFGVSTCSGYGKIQARRVR